VARAFNKMGYNAFVAHYRIAPHRFPEPLIDAAQAIRIVRSRAHEWNVNPLKLAVCGFSAGGHRAASIGVHFTKAPSFKGKTLDSISCRPDALILCYPWISTFGKYKTGGIVPDNASKEQAKEISTELYVNENTPPAFIWQCFDDGLPVENSLIFASALRQYNIPYELHIFPKGGHGLSTAVKNPHVHSWVALAGGWLEQMGFKKYVKPAVHEEIKYKDGFYKGVYNSDEQPYTATVNITIKNEKITGVEWKIEDTKLKKIFDKEYEKTMEGDQFGIIQCKSDLRGSKKYGPQLIQTQNIDEVDAITGATWSNKLFKMAVKDALKNAVTEK